MAKSRGDVSEILIDRVTAWLKQASLRGDDLDTLIRGVCDRLHAAGVPITRVHISVSMLHPLYDALGFTWRRGEGMTVEGFRASRATDSKDRFLASPYFHLLSNNLDHLRRRIHPGDVPEFPVFADLQKIGVTDYLAFVQPFQSAAGQGMMGSWSTDAADGFSDDMIRALLRVQDSLAVAAKMAVLSKLADNMMTTYLGGNAGRRVLSGQIRRGDGETIRAVLVMGDMRNSTMLAERGGRQVYIDTLNQFFDAVATPFNQNGGEILSFIGDGFLAVYPCERHREPTRLAAEAAMAAVREAIGRLAELNRGRAERKLDEVRFGLGLHIGNVMLGNVGLKQRLTFSAFGSAVNEAQRLESLTKKFDVPVIASEVLTNYVDGAWELKGRETLKGLRQKVAVYTPGAALLAPGARLEARDETGDGGSEAEQVMMLYRDRNIARPALIDRIRP
jgi:adenylate cyclase